MPNYPCLFQKSNKYSSVHLSKCDYCCSKLFTQTDQLLIWQHMLKCYSFFFNNKLRKIEKFKATLMQLLRLQTSSSPKSIIYEYQQYISSTHGAISIDISIFWGARFKKAPGAVCK